MGVIRMRTRIAEVKESMARDWDEHKIKKAQHDYFKSKPKMSPARRDYLESKVGMHPRRIKPAK